MASARDFPSTDQRSSRAAAKLHPREALTITARVRALLDVADKHAGPLAAREEAVATILAKAGRT
jgi:hypothetical protein